MKKALIVILSIIFVMGLSVSAFALHKSAQTEYEPGVVSSDGVKLTLSGSVRVRGELQDNTRDQDKTNSDRYAAYDSRVRIKLKAQTSKNTYGVIELETGLESWTDEKDNDYDYFFSKSDGYTWGVGGTGATGLYKKGNVKPSYLWIRQAYIAHQGKALGMLTGIKAGHMLLALGNGLFFDHSKFGDDAIVLWSEIPETTGEVSFAMVKLAEGNTRAGSAGTSGGPGDAEADDANAYVLTVALPGDVFTLSGDITYLDDQDFSNSIPPSGVDSEGLHFWNFGLRGHVNLLDDALTLKGDVEIQTGKAKMNYFPLPPDNPLVPTEREFGGYAWLVGADFDLNDMIDLNAEVAYGSGDKCNYDLPNADPMCGGVDSGPKYEGFVTTLGGSQHYTYVYDYRVTSAAGARGTGLANTWYINVGGTVAATSDLTIGAEVYFLTASKAVAINGAMNADSTLNTSKKIGTEIDAKLTYQIEKNLVYYVEGGYFFASDAYDIPQVCTVLIGCGPPATPLDIPMGTMVPGQNVSPDNAYALRNGLLLSF